MYSSSLPGNTNRHSDQSSMQAPHPGAPVPTTQPSAAPGAVPPHMRNVTPREDPRGIKRAREIDDALNPEPSTEPVLKQGRSEPDPRPELTDQQLLFNAIAAGDTLQVRSLLGRCPELLDLMKPGSIGMTPLCWAAYKGQRDIVDLLLKTGASVDARARNGSTPLMCAAVNGHTEVIQRLHLMGAHLDAENHLQCSATALLLATRANQLQACQYLVTLGANLSAKNSAGDTCLITAARNNRLDMAQWILKQNSSIDERNTEGATALMTACQHGHLEMAQWLVSQGASLFVKSLNGSTCLVEGATHNRLDIVRWLATQKVNINEPNNLGTTALMIACKRGYLEMAQLLVSQAASLFVKDSYGNTCLMAAAGNNQLEVSRWLLMQNISIDERNNHGFTALMVACKLGQLEMVQTLVSQGASLYVKNSIGNTCLIEAAAQNHLDVVCWLVTQKVSIDEGNNRGDTALMFACMQGHLEMAQALVSQGASLFVKDLQGYTCLTAAAVSNRPDIVRWLLENGASPDEPDIQSMTPIAHAFSRRHWTIVTVLIEYGVDLSVNVGDGKRLAEVIFDAAANEGHYEVVLPLFAKAWVLIQPEPLDHARHTAAPAAIFDLQRIVLATNQGGIPDFSDRLSLEQKLNRKAFARSYLEVAYGHVIGKQNLESSAESVRKHPLFSYVIEFLLELATPTFTSLSRALAGADKPVQVSQLQNILLFKLKSLSNSLQLAGIFSGKNLDPATESHFNAVLANKLEGLTLALKEASVIEQGEFAARLAELCKKSINITGQFDAAGFSKALAKHMGIYGVNVDRLTKVASKALEAVATRPGDLPSVASLGLLSRLNGQQVLDRLAVELQKGLLQAYEEPTLPGFAAGFAMVAPEDQEGHDAYADMIFGQWRQISAALGVVLPEIASSVQ